MTDSLYKLTSKISSEQTELVDGYLFENAPSNWVLEINYITGEGTLNGFFSSETEKVQEEQGIIKEIGHLVDFAFSSCQVLAQDWAESYKHHFSPWKYRGVHFVPIWLKDKYKLPENETSVMLDPGMAFGTGVHESTRMCLEFLIENIESSAQFQESIIDLGCGSGILAITSYLLGFKKVIGLDNDEDAVRISKENALLNQLNEQLSFDCMDLFHLEQPVEKFDCVVANIQADILTSCARIISQHTHQGSKIILSGILSKEIEYVVETFSEELRENSKFEYHIKEMGEWSAVQFIKSSYN